MCCISQWAILLLLWVSQGDADGNWVPTPVPQEGLWDLGTLLRVSQKKKSKEIRGKEFPRERGRDCWSS